MPTASELTLDDIRFAAEELFETQFEWENDNSSEPADYRKYLRLEGLRVDGDALTCKMMILLQVPTEKRLLALPLLASCVGQKFRTTAIGNRRVLFQSRFWLPIRLTPERLAQLTTALIEVQTYQE